MHIFKVYANLYQLGRNIALILATSCLFVLTHSTPFLKCEFQNMATGAKAKYQNLKSVYSFSVRFQALTTEQISMKLCKHDFRITKKHKRYRENAFKAASLIG